MLSEFQDTERAAAKVEVSGLVLDALTEREVVESVRGAWAVNKGGTIITVNLDFARAASRSDELNGLIARGTLVVADGMPLVWAARLAGDALPERVTGSSLIFSLSAAAEVDGKSIYILGGAEGVPEMAAAALNNRFTGLSIVGIDSPPFGFDQTEDGRRRAIDAVVAAAPDLVFVGLGFPKQEFLIEKLQQELPNAWFLACGGAIAMAAGVLPRASFLFQRLGLEWVHRLVLEPRRLARRYLRDGIPFAVVLLSRSAAQRLMRRECNVTA